VPFSSCVAVSQIPLKLARRVMLEFQLNPARFKGATYTTAAVRVLTEL
jgi:hypothetical protein